MKHGWGAVQVCTGVYRRAQVSTGVYRCVQVSTGVSRCVCDWMAALRLTCRWTRTAACCWESFPDSYWTGTCTGTCYTSTQHTNRETVRRTSSEQSPSEQNRTEQNNPTTMWPGFYMWFLSEWFLNLHLSGEVSLTVTLSFSGVKQLSLFFSCVQSCTLWCCWIQIKTSIADMEPGVCRHLKRLVLTFVFAVRYHHKPRDLQLVPGPLVMIKMYLCFLSTHHVI